MCQVSRVLHILHVYSYMFNIFEIFNPLIYKQYKGIRVLNIMREHCAGQKSRKKKGEKRYLYCLGAARYCLGISNYLLGCT